MPNFFRGKDLVNHSKVRFWAFERSLGGLQTWEAGTVCLPQEL
jgi:hypothetical protein